LNPRQPRWQRDALPLSYTRNLPYNNIGTSARLASPFSQKSCKRAGPPCTAWQFKTLASLDTKGRLLPMTNSKYLTAPLPSASMPRGIPYIVGNEAAERFSFYGMNCILIIFMTTYLKAANGKLDVMDEPQAKAYFHLFKSAVYFFPVFGAMLSDIFLGKYRTIILLSIVYCFGHLALAIDDTRLGLVIGLSLIVIGSGGIKPCVSANVGDQFGKPTSTFSKKFSAGSIFPSISAPSPRHCSHHCFWTGTVRTSPSRCRAY
jgi:hypothetical protein